MKKQPENAGGKWSICNLMIDIARELVDDLGDAEDFAKVVAFYAIFDEDFERIGDVVLDEFFQAILIYYAGVRLGYVDEDDKLVQQIHAGAKSEGSVSLTKSWDGARKSLPMLSILVGDEVQNLINSVSLVRKLTAGIPILSGAVQQIQAFEAKSDDNKKYLNYASIALIATVTFVIMKGCSS